MQDQLKTYLPFPTPTHLAALTAQLAVNIVCSIMSIIHQTNAHIQYNTYINYHFPPTCFGAYCAIFRKNFLVRSKLLLHLWLHRFVNLYSYLKKVFFQCGT